LNVSVYRGKVTLRGTLGASEAKHAISAARRVRGVHEVDDLLHTTADAIS
jgi:osmotically-inducible protein OsmY